MFAQIDVFELIVSSLASMGSAGAAVMVVYLFLRPRQRTRRRPRRK